MHTKNWLAQEFCTIHRLPARKVTAKCLKSVENVAGSFPFPVVLHVLCQHFSNMLWQASCWEILHSLDSKFFWHLSLQVFFFHEQQNLTNGALLDFYLLPKVGGDSNRSSRSCSSVSKHPYRPASGSDMCLRCGLFDLHHSTASRCFLCGSIGNWVFCVSFSNVRSSKLDVWFMCLPWRCGA